MLEEKTAASLNKMLASAADRARSSGIRNFSAKTPNVK